MNDKMKLAEKLYDAVGGIDDSLVQEAGAPFRRRKSRAVLKVLLIAAIIQTLIIAMLAGAVGTAMIITGAGGGMNDSDGKPMDDSPAYTPAGVISVTKAAKENVDLMSGVCSVVIQYEERSECTVIRVTDSKMNELLEMCRREECEIPDGSYGDCRIWLCDKKGFVVSPQLKRSGGNVGFGELFDYSAEIPLSYELTQTLDRMTGRE